MKHKSIFLGLVALLLACTLYGQAVTLPWDSKPSSETVIDYTGFTISYNHDTKCPNWVSWELTPEEAAADAVGRTDFFQPDPELKGPQAEYVDYTRNKYGLDRGHMAPSADFRWSKTANEQTFYLTNICPQDHTLNEGLWLELEQRCRAWAKRYNSAVQIICGPIHEEVPNTIGKNRVWVPAAFFKIITMTVDGTKYCIAFLFPNEPVNVNEDIFDFMVDAELISARTGLNTPWATGGKINNPGKAYPFDIPWKKPKSK